MREKQGKSCIPVAAATAPAPAEPSGGACSPSSIIVVAPTPVPAEPLGGERSLFVPLSGCRQSQACRCDSHVTLAEKPGNRCQFAVSLSKILRLVICSRSPGLWR